MLGNLLASFLGSVRAVSVRLYQFWLTGVRPCSQLFNTRTALMPLQCCWLLTFSGKNLSTFSLKMFFYLNNTKKACLPILATGSHIDSSDFADFVECSFASLSIVKKKWTLSWETGQPNPFTADAGQLRTHCPAQHCAASFQEHKVGETGECLCLYWLF